MERTVHHIVVGCDGSPAGRDAVVLGAAVAAACGAELTLVGVFPNAVIPIRGVSDRRTMRRHAETALRADRHAFAPDATLHVVADYSVPHALRHYAERWRADLVIVGSDPGAADGQAKISRRARQLLHGAPFAVAVAARGLHERPFKLATVGVGYDGGPEAEVALATGAAIAGPAGAKLSILSVVEDLAPRMSGHEWMQTGEWSALHQSRREDALLSAEQAASNLDLACDVDVIVGDPGLRMLALSSNCDLVVVGSRRWGAIARIVSGSVGETLVMGAGCSVMIVARPAPARRRGGEHATAEAHQRARNPEGSSHERDRGTSRR